MNELKPLDEANVNSDKVSKSLEPGTKINYDRMLHLSAAAGLHHLPQISQDW